MARAATKTSEERFEGFADTQARFFRALAKNQNRDWFLAHREEYERGWLDPMHALLAELRDAVASDFPHFALAEPKVFRIYRDVRFSRDKAPYKTRIAGQIPLDGAPKGPGGPAAVYLHIGTDTYVGAGHYVMDAPQLERFRAAVLDERRGGDLGRTVAKLGKAGFTITAYDKLKKTPRGIDPDHPRADLLRHKGLIASFPELPRKIIVSRELIGWLKKHTKQTAPLVEWLATNV